jgi:hypothetical protein
MDPKELPLDPHHEGVPSGVSKMIYEPMVRSAQTAHLRSAKINNFSKWTQPSFPLTHVTEEFDRVCPKQPLSILHVRRKPCTYLALILTVSPSDL